MPVTMRDLAHEARVSLGTVCRVLQRKPNVDPALREAVDRAAAKLGYRPTRRVRDAASDGSPFLAFVLANRGFLHPVHSRILEGVEEHCEDAGALVIYTRLQYRPEEPFRQLRLPRVVRTFAADCLILAGTNYGNLPDALDHARVPFVYLGNNLEGADRKMNGVFWDDIGGAAEATRYLIELGHREIWYLGDTTRPWLRRPFEGYLSQMQRAGLPARAQTAALASEPFQNGKASMEMLLEHQTPCTAIIADAEELEGTFAALDAAGWVAPRDVSMVAIGSLGPGREGRHVTSVDVDFVQVGRILAEQAWRKARTPGDDLPDVVVPTQLIKRGSCRPLPAGLAGTVPDRPRLAATRS